MSVLMLLLAVSGALSYDVAIAVVQVMLSIAPVNGIIENYKSKTGWSKDTTATVSVGLLSIAVMMFIIGLPVTGAAVLSSAATWGILAVQAAVY